jgi:hypothetical protein
MQSLEKRFFRLLKKSLLKTMFWKKRYVLFTVVQNIERVVY